MATIGKTFSNPDKWESAWFSRLKPGQKLLFVYLWERCDHAGVIEVVPAVWSAHIGQQVTAETVSDLVKHANHDQERVMRLDGKIWFTEYIRYNQQSDPDKPLSENYSFHRHVFKRIKEHNLVEEVQKRDPVLLNEFIPASDEETSTYKASVRLSEVLPKSTGKGQGKGTGTGKGVGEGITPATNGDSVKKFEQQRNEKRVNERFKIEGKIPENERQEMPF